MRKLFKKVLGKLKTDIQTNQMTIVMSVLLIGVYVYGLNMDIWKLLVTFATTTTLDCLLIRYETWTWRYPFSGTNAGFWISFFLRADSYFVYFFAWVLAIVGKHVFRVRWRHFMNPSNMAVFVTLVLMPQFTWTNPLQWWKIYERWGIPYLYAFFWVLAFWLFIMYRLSLLKKMQQFDLPIVFIFFHILLFGYFENWNWQVMALFFTPSFLILTFFMITDPRTTPENPPTRILFAMWNVLCFYILWYFINENYSLLWALFCMTMTLPFIWKIDEKISKDVWKYSRWFICLLIINAILASILIGLVIYRGKPDLVFDNRCNQLICRYN